MSYDHEQAFTPSLTLISSVGTLWSIYKLSYPFASFHKSASGGKSAVYGVMQLHEIWLLSVTKWSISIFSTAWVQFMISIPLMWCVSEQTK